MAREFSSEFSSRFKVQGSRFSSLNLVTCLLAMAASLFVADHVYGLPWSTDLYGRPELAVGTGPKAPPEHTVPTTGAEPPMSSRMSVRIKAGLTLKNPVPISEESLATGKTLFNIYCTPCHGPQGKGDGSIIGRGIPSSDLHADRIKRQKDGYMYATIRSGGIIMPSYNHALSTKERWDIVNYVRQLQGQ
jgi:mono/diheme cytochrome c family protein